MATPAEPDLPNAPARARSGLSAAELAAGLIAEEVRSNMNRNVNLSSRRWQEPKFFRGPPAPLSMAERISQSLKTASEWGGAQIRRVLNRSTYSEVVGRQSPEKRHKIGEESWEILKRNQNLLKYYDNDVLPNTLKLVEEAKIVASTQNAQTMRPPPRLTAQRKSASDFISDIPPRGDDRRQASLYPDLMQRSFIRDARAAEQWLRQNPDTSQKNTVTPMPSINPGPQRWVSDSLTNEGIHTAAPLAGQIDTTDVELFTARETRFHTATLFDAKTPTRNSINASQHLPPSVQSDGIKPNFASITPAETHSENSIKPRTRRSR